MTKTNKIIHHLINQKRKQKGLAPVLWSDKMYRLAKDQSNKMAKAGRLFHSNRYALRGGECICGGNGLCSPKDFVRSWMRSSRHRAWLLDPRVKTAAVSVSHSRHGSYAAWSFSDQPPMHFPHRQSGSHKPMLDLYLISAICVGKTLKWANRLFSTSLIVLGAHGLWIWFSYISEEPIDKAKLFLLIPTTAGLQNVVEWMSAKSMESWYFPTLLIAGGLILFNWLGRKLNDIESTIEFNYRHPEL